MNTNQSDARINNQADSRYSTNQTEQRHNSSTWDKYGINNITRVTLDFVTILNWNFELLTLDRGEEFEFKLSQSKSKV